MSSDRTGKVILWNAFNNYAKIKEIHKQKDWIMDFYFNSSDEELVIASGDQYL